MDSFGRYIRRYGIPLKVYLDKSQSESVAGMVRNTHPVFVFEKINCIGVSREENDDQEHARI
jgi:hypothetical protein